MNRTRIARTGLIALAGWLMVPALAWADTPTGSGPQPNGPEPVGQLLNALVGIGVTLAIVGVVIGLLVGIGRAVARIGDRPQDQRDAPTSTGRGPSTFVGIFSLIGVVAAAIVGLFAGRAFAYMSSEGGLGNIFAMGYLILFLGGSVIALVVVGLAATKFRHGHVTWAIGAVFGSAALLVAGTFVGRATAPATGGTYHEPVVLVAPASVHIRFNPVALAFVAQDGGQAECHSVPDHRTFNDLSALDLGELGQGTLRGGFTIWADGSGSGSLELFIDGGDLPEGSPMVSWVGPATVTSISSAGDSGALSFDGLVRSAGDGKPVPVDSGQELATPAPVASEWPATLSGSIGWACQPWLAAALDGAIPPPSLAPRSSQNQPPLSTPDATAAPEPTEFGAPAPTCPAPQNAIQAPDVLVTVGDGPAVLATRGPSTMTTCSTTAVADGVPGDPVGEVLANSGDQMTLTLPAGWSFLRWEGSDHPAAGDGGNVWLPVDVAGAPSHIDVPVPLRTGASVANYSLWVVGFDGRVVGQLAISVAISVT